MATNGDEQKYRRCLSNRANASASMKRGLLLLGIGGTVAGVMIVWAQTHGGGSVLIMGGALLFGTIYLLGGLFGLATAGSCERWKPLHSTQPLGIVAQAQMPLALAVDRRCSCGAPNPDGSRYCGRCGLPLVDVCPSCGAIYQDGDAFCRRCGHALQAIPATRVAAPTVVQQVIPAAPSLDAAGIPFRSPASVFWATFFTLGLYAPVWFAQSWSEIRRMTGNRNMYPFWHGLAVLVPLINAVITGDHFARLKQLTKQAEVRPVAGRAAAFVMLLAIPVAWLVPSVVANATYVIQYGSRSPWQLFAARSAVTLAVDPIAGFGLFISLPILAFLCRVGQRALNDVGRAARIGSGTPVGSSGVRHFVVLLLVGWALALAKMLLVP